MNNEIITSLDNPMVKEARSLNDKKFRRFHGKFNDPSILHGDDVFPLGLLLRFPLGIVLSLIGYDFC